MVTNVADLRAPKVGIGSAADEKTVSSLLFAAYIALTLTTFLNLPPRIPGLGLIRPTLLLVGVITALLMIDGHLKERKDTSPATRILNIFIIYVFVSLPFVQYPGSVLRENFSVFVKAVVFFYFTIQIVDTERRLKIFLLAAIGSQVFRVLEPLALHLTTGYWGSATHVGGGQFVARLSGAPHDIINPNGLAFVFLTALPFMHYLLLSSRRRLLKLAYFVLLPPMVYAFLLTGSRSGLIGLGVIFLAILFKSRHRTALIAAAAVATMVAIPMLGSDLRERYLSITSTETRYEGSREGRINGVINDFYVGLRRPLFGHGLGTSLEAKWNSISGTRVSHNLYTETLIEVGGVGLAIFLAFIAALLKNFKLARERIRLLLMGSEDDAANFYLNLTQAIHVWILMCLVFSLAQYGLSEFHWYLVGGLSVAMLRLVEKRVARVKQAATGDAPAPEPKLQSRWLGKGRAQIAERPHLARKGS